MPEEPKAMNEVENAVQEMYATTPEGTRAAFHGEKDRAVAYYQDYIAFVRHVAPPALHPDGKPRLLDIGCGWSSYAFVEAGYHATGIDLNAGAFEPPPTPELMLLEASATDLPFPDDSFDVVAAYQCIEHVPDPERAAGNAPGVQAGRRDLHCRPQSYQPDASLQIYRRVSDGA